MQFNLTFDAAVPAAVRTCVQTAANVITSHLFGPQVYNINVGWGDTGGIPVPNTALSTGGPSTGLFSAPFGSLTYAQLRAELTDNPTSKAAWTFGNALPALDPIHSPDGWFIPEGQMKTLGLIPANNPFLDGSIGFSTVQPFDTNDADGVDIGSFSLQACATVELLHAMGTPYSGGGAFITSLDLGAFNTTTRAHDYTGGPNRSFSVDGGKTLLDTFNVGGDPTLFDNDPGGILGVFKFPGIVYGWSALDNVLLSSQGLQLTGNINGGDGNDILRGGAAADTLVGMSGNDTLNGGGGNDFLLGDLGNDILNGAVGADTMIGGQGNDAYYVDNALDVATETAGQGTDTVYASASYSLTAGSAIEFLRGNGIVGLSLNGNALVNTIAGTVGNDVLNGGAGNDTLNGGTGGNDVFKFLAGMGQDTIVAGFDFDPVGGQDLMNIAGLGVTAATFAANVHVAAGGDGASLVTFTGNTNSVRLLNMAPANITQSDFILA